MGSYIRQLTRSDISAHIDHQLRRTSAEVSSVHRYIRKQVFRLDSKQDINSFHSAYQPIRSDSFSVLPGGTSFQLLDTFLASPNITPAFVYAVPACSASKYLLLSPYRPAVTCRTFPRPRRIGGRVDGIIRNDSPVRKSEKPSPMPELANPFVKSVVTWVFLFGVCQNGHHCRDI
jgi:hypothetical protein